MQTIEAEMEKQWDKPPEPFNPSFDPESKFRYDHTTKLLDAEEQKSGHGWSLARRAQRWGEIYQTL